MENFDIMEACEASAKDFCKTLLFCLEDDGVFTKEDGSLDEDFKKDYKEYLDNVLEYHYNTDFGEQGENITKYLDECGYYYEKELILLKEEEQNIEKWLRESGYTDGILGANFESIDGHLYREMDFEYNGNIEELDVDKLAAAIAENVIDERFSVRVSTYDEYAGEVNSTVFCVEIWLNK